MPVDLSVQAGYKVAHVKMYIILVLIPGEIPADCHRRRGGVKVVEQSDPESTGTLQFPSATEILATVSSLLSSASFSCTESSCF